MPKKDLLTLEELDRVCTVFIEKACKKLRITGGEPLVRRDIMQFFRLTSRHLKSGALQELTLTTNGSQLEKFAPELADCGVKRINVSIDTLDPAQFRELTRRGEIDVVLRGVEAAKRAGMRVKINAVALKGITDREVFTLIDWSHQNGHDLTFIEVMPMGEIEPGRIDQYLPLSRLRAQIGERLSLEETSYRTGGPARYFNVKETGGRIGFITRSPITSAKAAIACASPAPAHCSCASAGGCRRSANADACFGRQ